MTMTAISARYDYVLLYTKHYLLPIRFITSIIARNTSTGTLIYAFVVT